VPANPEANPESEKERALAFRPNSKIDAVIVYREGATVRRVATIAPGTARQIRLGGLPLALEPSSVRARVRQGVGRVVDIRPDFDVAFGDAVHKPAEMLALEEARDKLAHLERVRERLKAEIEELRALTPILPQTRRGEAPRPAPIEAMRELSDFVEDEVAQRLARQRVTESEIEEKKNALTLRQRQFDEASSANRTEGFQVSRTVTITLEAAPSETIEIELDYDVPGARWVPSYALELERGLQNGALKMRASIVQNTGEDWSGVSLALSTAMASRRASIPELKALKIGRKQEDAPRSGWREVPSGLDSLFESYDEAVAAHRPTPPSHARARPSGSVAKAAGPAAVAAAMPRGAAYGAPPEALTASLAAPPPAPPPAPLAMGLSTQKSAMRARAPMPSADFGGAGAYPDAEPSEVLPDARASDSSLAADLGDYAQLRLAAPDDRLARGRLRLISDDDARLLSHLSSHRELARAGLSQARREAQSTRALAPPSRCQPVAAIEGFDYRFDCAARLDVPSTGRWVSVPVMSCSVALGAEYVCVPSVEAKVYRTLNLTNRGEHALLPGPVDISAGDVFLMTTELPAMAPSGRDSKRIGLGVEEAIKVARRTTYNESTGGFLGGSSVLTHQIEIELNNQLATPVRIEVRERVPRPDPQEKDLKVEELAASPPWERVDEPIDGSIVKGTRRWRVSVEPGQRQTLSAQYAIRLPADRMVVGGNRRDQ
jgi:hypothetical protein